MSEFASPSEVPPFLQSGRGGHRPPATVPHRQGALADKLLGKRLSDAAMRGDGGDAD